MSYWNAKYTNEYGEYEITFASPIYNTAKAVEKICEAVIDEKVDTPDDIEVVVHGRWEWDTEDIYMCSNCCRKSHVKEVMGQPDWDFCPVCGAKMDGGSEDG